MQRMVEWDLVECIPLPRPACLLQFNRTQSNIKLNSHSRFYTIFNCLATVLTHQMCNSQPLWLTNKTMQKESEYPLCRGRTVVWDLHLIVVTQRWQPPKYAMHYSLKSKKKNAISCSVKESKISWIINFWVISHVPVYFTGKSAVQGTGPKNWAITAVHLYSVEFKVLSWLPEHYFFKVEGDLFVIIQPRVAQQLEARCRMLWWRKVSVKMRAHSLWFPVAWPARVPLVHLIFLWLDISQEEP